MRSNLVVRPAMMKDHMIKVAPSATYLGMKVSEDRVRESIHESAKNRILKAWTRVREIKAIINDHRVKQIGWLKAGVVLTRAIILPSLTYSSEVWYSMYKYTKNYIEAEYKAMI